ncbi:hypothetical protein GCM10007036_20860 [Alsobacter metallidurans]|uniref:Uncharacterized protein n=1 Tax=Alsobacter metallidurans TaxID=340221 RepID=A0A917I6N6_9HYPH|nr:hypothetical protein [Alsobacter metallidurans]GGH18559.1 hypothetical protein GCM10007036_20860 [Alsobacter metallidurans]
MRSDATLAADAVTIMAMMEALRVAFEAATDGGARDPDDLDRRILREVKQMELPSYSYGAQAKGIEEAIACIRLAVDQARRKAA